MKTINRKYIELLDDYNRMIIAEGLSKLFKRKVKDDIDSLVYELEALSNKYGGSGLISVMDYVRNS